MIHSYTCKNFYSFDEEVNVNFVVDDNAPKNNSYTTTESGTRLSLIETVIGPNASGKTNLLKVLPLIKWLIVDSWDMNPSSRMPVKVFAPHDGEDIVTELSVVFEVGGDVYEYEIHLDEKKIHFEQLNLRNKTSQRTTTKTILKRELGSKGGTNSLEMKGFSAPTGFAAILRDNATAISTGIRLNHKLSSTISEYWQKVDFNVSETGYIGEQVFANEVSAANAVRYFHFNRPMLSKAEDMLSRYDLGFNSFQIKEDDNNQLTFKVAHNFGNKELSLPLGYESSGTRQLFVLLWIILSALEAGGIAILDEFDARLHPDMVTELVGLFTDKATNPKCAQLLMSTHSHKILSVVDKYQIVITEKNALGATDAWRLDELKGVRAGENYYTKYMSGAYGGVPNLS